MRHHASERLPVVPPTAEPVLGLRTGPQWVLDQWGNAANNTHGKDMFDFIRIEDTAYDKRRNMSERRLHRGLRAAAPTGAANQLTTSTNGRIWKLELDKKDPTARATLSVLIQGDDNPVKTLDRDPPAGQRRDDGPRQPPHPGGPGLEPAVRGH